MFLIPWLEILDISKVFFSILMFLLFILGTDLILRYFRTLKEIRNDPTYEPAYLTFLFIGIGIFGYGVYMIFAIIDYFYVTPLDWGLSLQALIPMLIVTLFTFMTENLVFRRKKGFIYFRKFRVGFLTLIAISFCIFAGIRTLEQILDTDLLWDGTQFLPVYIGIGIFGLVSFVGLITLLFYRLHPRGKSLKNILFAVVSSLFCAGGAIISALGALSLNEFYFMGTIVEICGWIMIRHFILAIPFYSELAKIQTAKVNKIFNFEDFARFFSIPDNSQKLKTLRSRFSRHQGPGKPPRGEFSAIILLVLENPDVFGNRISEKKKLLDTTAFILNDVLKIESDPDRIRKNTVHHIQMLKSYEILREEAEMFILNSDWQTKLESLN